MYLFEAGNLDHHIAIICGWKLHCRAIYSKEVTRDNILRGTLRRVAHRGWFSELIISRVSAPLIISLTLHIPPSQPGAPALICRAILSRVVRSGSCLITLAILRPCASKLSLVKKSGLIYYWNIAMSEPVSKNFAIRVRVSLLSGTFILKVFHNR